MLAYVGEYADAIYVVDGQEKYDFETLRFNLRKFVVFEGKNYLEYGRMLFVIKNKPYVKDSYIMMPVRDIYCIINKVSDLGNDFSIRWIGGDKEIVELLNGSGMPINILNIFLRKTENTWDANSKAVSFEI